MFFEPGPFPGSRAPPGATRGPNCPKNRGRIYHCIFLNVCLVMLTGLHAGRTSNVLLCTYFVAIKPRNNNYNSSFVFWLFPGQAWPPYPFQRVRLDKWCRAQLKLTPETNSKAMSWPFPTLGKQTSNIQSLGRSGNGSVWFSDPAGFWTGDRRPILGV